MADMVIMRATRSFEGIMGGDVFPADPDEPRIAALLESGLIEVAHPDPDPEPATETPAPRATKGN